MAIGRKTGGGSRKGRPGRVAATVKEALLAALPGHAGCPTQGGPNPLSWFE
jgi:hypothetical protein